MSEIKDYEVTGNEDPKEEKDEKDEKIKELQAKVDEISLEKWRLEVANKKMAECILRLAMRLEDVR